MNILAPGLSIFIGNTIYSVRTICLTSMVTQKETTPNSFPTSFIFSTALQLFNNALSLCLVLMAVLSSTK